jgi:hypothetical protein
VEIDVAGNVSFSEWSAAAPPGFLCAAASAILRTLLRDPKISKARAWPRRIQRWRAEPDSGEPRG